MITLQKLKIFEIYGGDLGRYERAKDKHLKILPYQEFGFIERLIQDMMMVKKGLTASSYEENVNNTIKENFDNEETINYLKKIEIKND